MENKIEEYYNEGTDSRDLPSKRMGIVEEEHITKLNLMKILDAYNEPADNKDPIDMIKLPFQMCFDKDNAYQTYYNLTCWYNGDDEFKYLGENMIDLLVLSNMEEFFNMKIDLDDFK